MSKTPIDMLAPGVDPSLNREPPSAVDARRIIILIGILLLMVCGVGTLIVSQVAASRGASAPDETAEATEEPTLFVEATSVPTHTLTPSDTPMPTSTPTIDDWSLTGTALFFSTSTATFTPSLTPTWTPTLDYCWWMTPSPTPSVTPNLPTATLDDWSLSGTQMFIEAHTLTPTMPPTQRPPRALCDDAPTPEAPTREVMPTHDGPFPTLDIPVLPPPTWTNVPPAIVEPVYQAPALQYIEASPQVVYITVQAPIAPPVVVVITATRLPATATFTPSLTASATNTPTSTPTDTATATMTASPTSTPSLTASATSTPTDTATATWTPSATLAPTNTPTDVPTSTPLPTATFTASPPPTAMPVLSISGSCDGGHLLYTVTNAGGELLEQIQYRLIDQLLLVNSTGLFGGIPSGGSVVIDVGNPAPGLWILGFDYAGQTIYSTQVNCEGSP